MLRITRVSPSPAAVVLKVEGAIAGQEVALLEQEGTPWLGQTGRLVLDLDGVQFIDENGLELLRNWSEKGVGLCGGSLYVRTLLLNMGGASVGLSSGGE